VTARPSNLFGWKLDFIYRSSQGFDLPWGRPAAQSAVHPARHLDPQPKVIDSIPALGARVE
jgi:hypothetical protein